MPEIIGCDWNAISAISVDMDLWIIDGVNTWKEIVVMDIVINNKKSKKLWPEHIERMGYNRPPKFLLEFRPRNARD